jgi:hypothetical protein
VRDDEVSGPNQRSAHACTAQRRADAHACNRLRNESNTEVRIMMPAENPMPAAIARAFSRSQSASATPMEVVRHDNSDSRMTAV